MKPGQTFWRARAWALADMCVLSKVASAGFHLVANQAFARMTAWPCVQSMIVIGPPWGGGRSRGRGRRAVSVAARQWAPRRAGRIAWPARPACLRLVSRTAPPRPKRGPPTDRESEAASRARTPQGPPTYSERERPSGRRRPRSRNRGGQRRQEKRGRDDPQAAPKIPRRLRPPSPPLPRPARARPTPPFGLGGEVGPRDQGGGDPGLCLVLVAGFLGSLSCQFAVWLRYFFFQG